MLQKEYEEQAKFKKDIAKLVFKEWSNKKLFLELYKCCHISMFRLLSVGHRVLTGSEDPRFLPNFYFSGSELFHVWNCWLYWTCYGLHSFNILRLWICGRGIKTWVYLFKDYFLFIFRISFRTINFLFICYWLQLFNIMQTSNSICRLLASLGSSIWWELLDCSLFIFGLKKYEVAKKIESRILLLKATFCLLRPD